MPLQTPPTRRLALSLLLAAALPAWAQAPVERAEQEAVLKALAQELEGNFVFPEIGQRYAERLRELARGAALAAQREPEAFASAVTHALQAVHPDGHLKLRLRGANLHPGAPRPTPPQPLEKAELMGELAYLKLNLFPNDRQLATRLRAFLTGPGAQAKALVLDARGHRGGGLLEMDVLLSLIYAEPRRLVRMETRAEAFQPLMGPGSENLRRQDSPASLVRHDHWVQPDPRHRSLQQVPVYYLTSERSASAAEHLALALQSSGRATLIGATTRGAGHFGGPAEFGRFSAFIPVGRTYDPVSGQDWEGRGIRPDIEVPAEQALDKALELAAARGLRLR